MVQDSITMPFKNGFSFLGGPLNPKPSYVVKTEQTKGVYDLCLNELKEYGGVNFPEKPILLSVGGKVFDVSEGSKFYGHGQPYNLFAGKACTRALSIGSLDPKVRMFLLNLHFTSLHCCTNATL